MGFSNNFHGRFRWNKFVSMDVHQWKRPWKSVEMYLLGNTWKLPLSVEPEASIASIYCSFHEYVPWKLPWASIYFFIIPSTSTSITNFHLLAQDSHKGPPSSFRSASIDASTKFQRKLPWKSTYFHESFHGIPWKLPWKSVENIYFHGDFHGSWWN